MELKNNMEEKCRYFGMYIGIADYLTHNNNIFKLCGVYKDLVKNHSFNAWSLGSVKLILKPLSELWENEEDWEKVFGNKKADDIDNQGILIEDSNMEYIEEPNLANYMDLASLGYAIPVQGIHDPFELGWAIRKEDVS